MAIPPCDELKPHRWGEPLPSIILLTYGAGGEGQLARTSGATEPPEKRLHAEQCAHQDRSRDRFHERRAHITYGGAASDKRSRQFDE